MMAKSNIETKHYHWLPFGDYRSVGDVAVFRLLWLVPIYKRVGDVRSLLGIAWGDK